MPINVKFDKRYQDGIIGKYILFCISSYSILGLLREVIPPPLR